MELNTPNRNHTISSSSSSSTPLSQFQDSPVFNYINNLSPIELAKSVHSTDQTFNSLSFSSPPSVFASPKLTSLRDTRSFLKRRQFLETLKPVLSHSKDDNNTSEGVPEAVELDNSNTSAKEVTAEQPGEHLELAIELPQSLKNNGASTDSNIVPLDAIRTDTHTEKAEISNERHSSYESEKHLRKICRIEQNEDEAGGNWVALISNVDDMLHFESSIIEEQPEEQKMVDPGTISFISNVLQIPQDNNNDTENMESTNFVGSLELKMGEPGTQSTESLNKKETDKLHAVPSSTLQNKLAVSDAAVEVDIKGKKCQSSCKQNRIRRLVFEMGGAHKKKSVCNSDGTSSILPQSDCEVAPVEKHSTPRISTLSRKGIGLHLNALATTSGDGKVIKIETLSSTKQEINLVLYDCEDKVMENAPQTSVGVTEDVGISSPKIKRHKLEHVGASCKRCNCKRSKCLKLYCDCFAAGLYCIEPCSCQDCFNKPAHEDTVLETRKQIESRNPLAFAPKVIRSTDYVSDFGDETNKTPASARHKRGCNCKKSNCLKKYCECFQGGVGCSSNCRCEGCKNSFGSKNGFEENETEDGESEAFEKNDEGEEEHADLLRPSGTARSSIQLPMTFSGMLSRSLSAVGGSTQMRTSQKLGTEVSCQPKFETHLQVIPEEEAPETLTSNCSAISGVKSTSPNCKRVSPPHHGFGASANWKSSRKLILRSVPPFPSLNSPNQQKFQ
eukprot:XP_015584641.1 protein tesmin/TSO1-like CXC 3 isoform X1 [Ricinus communis]